MTGLLRENRNVLIGTAVVLAVWGLFYLFGVSDTWAKAEGQRVKHRRLETAVRKFFPPSGRPIAELKQAAAAEHVAVKKAIEELKAVQFELASRYTPKPAHGKKIYFQQQLDQVYGRVARLGVVEKGQSEQLGFARKFQDDTETFELLERLAVVARVLQATTPPKTDRRVKRVVDVEHPELVKTGRPDLDSHLVKVPAVFTLQTDEKALIHLLQDLQNPRSGHSYVGLDRIEIEVTEPESGVFTCKLSLFGMFLREGPLGEADGAEPWLRGGGGDRLPPLPGGRPRY